MDNANHFSEIPNREVRVIALVNHRTSRCVGMRHILIHFVRWRSMRAWTGLSPGII